MNVRKLSKVLEKVAKEELNEVPARREEDVQHIREWLQKQPHLNFPDDDNLILLFLRVCKHQLQQTKERIDNFCTMVTVSSELFSDNDPLAPEIQTILTANVFAPLPNKPDGTGPRILMMRYSRCRSETMSFINILKVWFMIVTILIKEDDNCAVCGLNMLIDCKDFPVSYMLQANLTLLKKLFTLMQKANPIRFKGIHHTNVSSTVEALYNMAKHLLSEKMSKRVFFYSTINAAEAYKVIDKSILPEEYGGDAGSFDDLAAAWKRKIESCRSIFLDYKIFFANEDLRPEQTSALWESLGVEGSFRKLDID